MVPNSLNLEAEIINRLLLINRFNGDNGTWCNGLLKYKINTGIMV